VLLGDSFIEGYKVTQNRIISTMLNQLLDVDVVNLGQCDYGPVHELAVLRHLGLRLQPSIVVWFFFEGNDLHDYEEVVQTYHERVEVYRSFRKRSFSRNALLHLAGWTNPILFSKQKYAWRRCGQVSSQAEDAIKTMYFEFKPNPVCNMTLFNQFEKIIKEAKSICEQSGIRLLLAYIPLKFRVYSDLLEFPHGSDLVNWQLSDLPERFARFTEKENMFFMNLTTALKRAADEGQLVYYLDDAHWTPEGHEVVAKHMAEVINKNGWLE
jgi:hypothetical protein